jgi:type 1 glutamine amidotransferase
VSRALFLYGGWPGHFPYEVAEWADGLMRETGLDVDHIHDPHRLEEDLTPYDVIVCGWTQAMTTEDLTEKAERSLLDAVAEGTGFVGWHGAAASFRASLPFSFLLGASFIEHPGGEGVDVPYGVHIVDHAHPITDGVEDFQAASEQYYMHYDPAVHVLATTTFTGEPLPWLEGVEMPIAYTKRWGSGRVFYHALGHLPKDLQAPPVERMIRQGIGWAVRRNGAGAS